MDLAAKVDGLCEAVAKLQNSFDKLIEKQNFIPHQTPNNTTAVNDYKSYEYFVHIKFRLREDASKYLYAYCEEYFKNHPFEGLKTCGIYDLENEAGEFAIMEYFDSAENYLKALDRADNRFLNAIKMFVIPYKDGDHFIGSHGRLMKSFDHIMLK